MMKIQCIKFSKTLKYDIKEIYKVFFVTVIV